MTLNSMTRHLTLCLAALLSAPVSAAGLNDTGQLTCLDANDQWTTACSGSPMDAGHGRDQSRANDKDGLAGFAYRRICNSGEPAGSGSCPVLPSYGTGATEWGCTLDKVSGLVWELKDAVDTGSRRSLYAFFAATRGGGGDPFNGTQVSDYVAWANTTALCGRSDWRLPTLQEITGILRFGGSDRVTAVPVADTAMGFPDLQRLDVDRSFITAVIDGPVNADGVLPYAFFGSTGWTGSPAIGRGLSGTGVRLVAGTSSHPRFWVQGRLGEEVLDRSTGLVWQRCRLGMRWNAKACVGTPRSVSWREALSASASEGWRLPNVKELTSLMTHQTGDSHLAPRFFPGLLVQPNLVWTATHSGESRDTDGTRTVLARQVSLVSSFGWWFFTPAMNWTAGGTPLEAIQGQVLLVKDR